jgi:hypothetical protein
VLRPLIAVGLGAASWAAITGFAVACFARQVTAHGPLLFQREVLGFASAFAAAGTISGSVALAAYGRWRRALGLWGTLVALFAASVALTRWGIARLTRPSVPWFESVWSGATVSIGFGIALGVLGGLIVSALVGLFAALTRRRMTWRVGLAVAALVAVLGFWAAPQSVPRLVGWAIAYAHWHHGTGYDEAIRGAGVGAGVGALAGAVVSVLSAGPGSARHALVGQASACRRRTEAAG